MEEEENLEAQRKHERLKRKMKMFMLDIAEDLVDDEILAKAKEKIADFFSDEKIQYNTMTLKAFREGYQFGVSTAMDKDMQLTGIVAVCIERLIQEVKPKTNPDLDSIIEKSMENPIIKKDGDNTK